MINSLRVFSPLNKVNIPIIRFHIELYNAIIYNSVESEFHPYILNKSVCLLLNSAAVYLQNTHNIYAITIIECEGSQSTTP